MIHHIFVDTNCFVHLRDLKDLSWNELFPGITELEIFVAPIVIDELDRLKVEKNDRIRKRCRSALKLIEEASALPDMQLEIRADPIKITLIVASAPQVNWSKFPRLDASRPDDHLIATALTEPLKAPPTLLSFDTGPLIRARMASLAAIRSPETWNLPEQKSDSEKKIGQLESELLAAKQIWPKIEANWVDIQDDGTIHLAIPQLKPLPSPLASKLLETVRDRFPISHVEKSISAIGGISIGIGGVTDEEASSYRDEYEKYIRNWQQAILNLHLLVEKAFRFGEIAFKLENVGRITAMNLLVSIEHDKDTHIITSSSEMEEHGRAIQIGEPPLPPRDSLRRDLLGGAQIPYYNQRRDPTGFYWLDGRGSHSYRSTLVCDEFRAKQEHFFNFYVLADKLKSGRVLLEVSAKNLDSPVRVVADFEMKPSAAEWSDSRVLARLPDWFAEVIRSDLGKT